MGRPLGSSCFFLVLVTFVPTSRHCHTPSIRPLRRAILFRSVQVRCSRFSRCCHLLVDLTCTSRMEVGLDHRHSHRDSAGGWCCRRGVNFRMTNSCKTL